MKRMWNGNPVQIGSCLRNCKLSRENRWPLFTPSHFLEEGKANTGTQARKPANFVRTKFSEEKLLSMRFCILFLFLLTGSVWAQSDNSEQLEEILLRGNFAGSVNPGYSIQTISDSILSSEYQSLGELLEKQSNLYFKQNGYGMVSSISLRRRGAKLSRKNL